MELPQADGKLIRVGQIENMKLRSSMVEVVVCFAALAGLMRTRLSHPISYITTRRLSPQVTLALITVAAAPFCILPETAHARDLIHKGDVVVVPLRGEVAPSLLAFLR